MEDNVSSGAGTEAEGVAARPLRGRFALLTGSVGGLGFATAEGLARAGCAVMLNGLEPEAEVEEKCLGLASRTGADIAYHQADLSNRAGVESLIGATVDRFGAIDILVNNAVVRHFAPIKDFPPHEWDLSLAVNLSAAFHAIRLALPGMRARNYGRIFNLTSVYGMRGTTNRVGYVTTKSALLGLTRAVALENIDCDVTCHCLCPGSVLTPGTERRVIRLMESEHLGRAAAEGKFLEGKQPGGRFVSPESVSAVLVFLCGPVARDLTGSMLPVEAGWLAS